MMKLSLLISISILFSLVIFIPINSFAVHWDDNDFSFRKLLTVDNTLVDGTDKSNFPVLVSTTDSDLAADAQNDGDDIIFYSSNGVKLAHEIEFFDGGTGDLVAWVRLPSLFGSVDTEFYMYYGNSTISSQQNKVGVWDSNYQAVWHLNGAGTADSTSNARTLTDVGTDSITGKISTARDFERNDDDRMTAGTWSVTGKELTISAWVESEGGSFVETNPRVMAKSNGLGEQNVNWGMAVDTSGASDQSRFRIKTGGNAASGSTTLLGGNSLSASTTYFFTNVYNGTHMNIYVDCTFIASTAKTGDLNVNNRQVALGGRTNRNWDGFIDEARVQSIIRDNGWICTEYNNQNSPSTFMSLGAEESQPVEGGQGFNEIEQVIKIQDVYPADTSFNDYVIEPPLTNITRAFAYVTFSHTAENDASDTFRSWEIIDENTLRLIGENTATGNNALQFTAFVVEFKDDSSLRVQKSQRATTASEAEGEKLVTLTNSINTTNSMIINSGQHMNFSDTGVGNEEFERVRITSTTQWGWLVADTPDTANQVSKVQIIDFNENSISVQRGIETMPTTAFTDTATIPTSVDISRSILTVTGTNNDAAAIDSDDAGIRAHFNSGTEIEISRGDNEGTINWAWEVTEFPEDLVKVDHFQSTISSGTLSSTFTVPEIKDMDKAISFSTVGVPFGYSGTAHENNGLLGSIDRIMGTLLPTNNTSVFIERQDSTHSLIIDWQLVQFLEKDFAERVDDQNALKKIVKISDSFLAGNGFQDYVISPSIDPTRSFLLMTMRDEQIGDSVQMLKSWEILDEDTLRIYGSQDPAVTNFGMNFTATIIELNQFSPVFVQKDRFQYTDSMEDGEKVMHMSPVNTTASFILHNGLTSISGEPTVGSEEIGVMRIINGSTWGWETDLPQDEQETVVRNQIIDLNQGTISVQRGTATLSGTSLSISPPTDVVRNQTIIFVTHRTTSGIFDSTPSDTSIKAFLDTSSPPDIVVSRDSTGSDIELAWEAIQFPSDFALVQHGEHLQTQGVSNDTATILPINNVTTSFVVGTVQTPFSQGTGSGNSTTGSDFGSTMGTLTLETNSTVRLVRDTSVGTWDMGFQVLDFTAEAGTDFTELIDSANNNVTVTDTVQTSLAINQTIGSGTNFVNVTDTVQTSLAINQTIGSGANNVNVTDSVATALGLSQTIGSGTNFVNVTDTFSLATNKTIGSGTNNVNVTDTFSLATNKTIDSGTNNVNVTDSVLTSVAFNQTIGSGANNVNVTDSVATALGLSQTIGSANNTVNVTDFVNLTNAINVIISSADNTVVTSDNVTVVNATIVIPPPPPPSGGGGSSSGGGGTPILPSLSAALTGLHISEPKHLLSTEIIVNPFFASGSEAGAIELNWDQLEPVKIRQIEVPEKFKEFVQFEKEGGFEFKGLQASPDENFATGVLPYEVKIPPLALGIGPKTNTLGDGVEFMEYYFLVLFNEYTIPIKVDAVHNNKEFELDTTITVSHLKEVRWVIIGITLAAGAWFAVWGKRVFRETPVPLKSGTFKKGLDKARRSTIDKQKSGSFRRELDRQRRADRENIKKIKRKRK